MGPRRVLKLSLFVFLIVMVVGSCSTGGEKIDEGSPSSVEGGALDLEEVVRQIRVQTLQGMLEEQDPESVFANVGPESSDILLGAEVVLVDGDSYSVETTRTKWDVTADLGGENSIASVDSALASVMKTNNVSWCDESVSGDQFVRDYMDLHEDSYETNDQFEESISNYVDCGAG